MKCNVKSCEINILYAFKCGIVWYCRIWSLSAKVKGWCVVQGVPNESDSKLEHYKPNFEVNHGALSGLTGAFWITQESLSGLSGAFE